MFGKWCFRTESGGTDRKADRSYLIVSPLMFPLTVPFVKRVHVKLGIELCSINPGLPSEGMSVGGSFSAGVGLNSPSRDSTNWLSWGFSWSVETLRRLA